MEEPAGVAQTAANGPVSVGLDDKNDSAAAIVAAGIGVFVMGLVQFISELSEAFNDSLALSKPLGPYSGKYVIAYLAWLISWAVLGLVARERISIKTAAIVTAVLVVAGAVLVFPPFIGLFAAGD